MFEVSIIRLGLNSVWRLCTKFRGSILRLETVNYV